MAEFALTWGRFLAAARSAQMEHLVEPQRAVVAVGAPRLRLVGLVEAGVVGTAVAGAVVRECRVAAAVVAKSQNPPGSLRGDFFFTPSYSPSAGWFLRA